MLPKQQLKTYFHKLLFNSFVHFNSTVYESFFHYVKTQQVDAKTQKTNRLAGFFGSTVPSV